MSRFETKQTARFARIADYIMAHRNHMVIRYHGAKKPPSSYNVIDIKSMANDNVVVMTDKGYRTFYFGRMLSIDGIPIIKF